MPDGILNIDKPAGPTSHDVVGRVRRLLGTRRVGHAGTLDPMATGVLLVGVGQGTRVMEYFQALPKHYVAVAQFGLETDTQDTTGVTLSQGDASGLTRDAVEAALPQFRGEIEQVPPMVSAVKVRGEPLYRLARRGETVERAARKVTIYELMLREFTPGGAPTAVLDVRCSGGTYVRTLIHDLGARLGCGAAMAALRRAAIGEFRVDEAVTLESLEDRPREEWATALIPLARALCHLPSRTLTPQEVVDVGHGRAIPAGDAPAGTVTLLDPEGQLAAMAHAVERDGGRVLAPEKVFVSADATR